MIHEGVPIGDMTRPAAIVFDMDGLLLDTERITLDGFWHACHAHGVHPERDVYLRCLGTTIERTRELLVEGHGPDFPYDAIFESWDGYCDEHIVHRPPPLKPGAREVLETVRDCAIPCALATATRDPEASDRLISVGLEEFFAVKVTGDRVEKGKPDPETYRTAAALLGVDPVRAWALEDSAPGVRSALAAGLRVFQIPDLVPLDNATLALGPTVLESLFDVDNLLQRYPRAREATAP
ncbi:MAG: HAD family phosphatase [Rhodospirillaceae bacterium]|nr:HAD family phosphatase [Rhodospirillaceae bacterium]